jgi:PilZ domain
MADTPLVHRKEIRVPLKMFVNLSSSDNPSFELAPTIDISCHGARIVTRRRWQPNQQLSVRSIRGTLNSRARVVHCQLRTDNLFVIGIEIYSPSAEWTGRDMTDPVRNFLTWGPRTGRDNSWW